ncbi:MAG: T9SS type A sorting domain-containing protein [Balneolaceae bacterium]
MTISISWSSAKWFHFALLLFFWITIPRSLFAQGVYAPALFPATQAGSQTIFPDPVQGTLHIVAVMVEFEPDTNRFTTGNGTFGPGSMPFLESPDITIDPLPHDKGYFEAHLTFAKNYFERVSGGLLNVEFQVLDDIFRLPNPMETYSPIGENPSSEPLGELARDAWQAVQESGNLNLNVQAGPDDTIAFVLFHAGAGRDIQLTGTSLTITPQDIPSVYISTDAFRRLFNDPSFSGFPIDNGNLLVTNTLILPRTLSRPGEDITGAPLVLQLSTNGMVTAQLGSHLGLPDLFNTQNGQSGIGRFGLMDGAGIFAYNGLIPPELSAFERMWLGWDNPFSIETDRTDPVELPAVSLREPNRTARHSISVDEYFLVENRHRDPQGNGVTLTIRRPDGSITQQTFTNADTTFIFQSQGFNELFEPGVIIDADNYDFVLPGGPTDGDDDDRTLNGGVLIWHIDEGIIRSRLARNEGINDDPNRRGVNLQEADGAQDIGQPTTIGFFDNPVNGSAFDFWWSGNNASVVTQTGTFTFFENRFGPDTTPNNRSNSGAPSFFEMLDFSDNLPVASFQIQRANPAGDTFRLFDELTLDDDQFFTPAGDSYWRSYPLSSLPFNDDQIILPSQTKLYFYNTQNRSLLESAGNTEGIQQPVFTNPTGMALGQKPDNPSGQIDATFFQFSGSNALPFWNFSVPAHNGFISSPEPTVLHFDGSTARALTDTETVEPNFFDVGLQQSESVAGYQSRIDRAGQFTFTTPSASASRSVTLPEAPFFRMFTGLAQTANGSFLSFLLTENQLLLAEEAADGEIIFTPLAQATVEWPAITDLNSDGFPNFLYVNRDENQLESKNRNGALDNGFPIRPPSGFEFRGTPLVADLDGNGELNLVVVGQSETSLNLFAYRPNGNPVDGFPLLVGGIQQRDDEPIHPIIHNQKLIAVSHRGDFKVWEFPDMSNVQWAGRFNTSTNNNVTALADQDGVSPPAFGVLNSDETYNWPNPARDETYLRFQLSSPGTVHVKISTLSGTLVYERTVESRGLQPEEFRIDTSSWGSGAYFAVVSAQVNGQTERKLVKIAVAR